MLHEFIAAHRDEILTRTSEKLTNRPWPLASTVELEHGVPLFLSQLQRTLRAAIDGAPTSQALIAASAARHGRELLSMGFNLSQVVHDYGDICQAVTEAVIAHRAPISAGEFHVLNQCLDTAIAEAVTEHARATAATRTSQETERIGRLTHEIRDLLNTAFFAFDALKRGTVAVNGSTGAVLGRSLTGLRDLVATTLSDVRLTASHQQRKRISAEAFLRGVATEAHLNADHRGVHFSASGVSPELMLDIDPQWLGSAVMNLLNNAFKFTPAGGHVTLGATHADSRLRIEVADECGGIAGSVGTLFEPFTERRSGDRTGLGLGLSIARTAVAAHGGDIQVRNLPGHGCVFLVDLPLAVVASAEMAPS